MKNTTLIVCLLLLIFCCKPSQNQKKYGTQPIFITAAELKKTVTFLASDNLNGRQTGTEGINEAANYIESKFKELGVKPYFESYRDNFAVGDLDAFNIVGYIEGIDTVLKEEIIIIGAHYDHIGNAKQVGDDIIANGANDNATGTSAVIALAKYFAKTKSNKRSLVLVLFSAEEMGLLGSKHIAKRLKDANANLYAMLNFEMIGVPLIDTQHMAFVSGYDLSNMAEKINAYTNTNLIGMSVVAKKYSLFKRSDNYPFYQEFNLPCQTISSCDLSNFDYYHHVDDETEKMNFTFMASLINKLIPAIEKMSNTPTKEIKMHE